MADLCYLRNYIAIKILESIYTYEICYVIIIDSTYNRLLRKAFVNLILSLWIDR